MERFKETSISCIFFLFGQNILKILKHLLHFLKHLIYSKCVHYNTILHVFNLTYHIFHYKMRIFGKCGQLTLYTEMLSDYYIYQ